MSCLFNDKNLKKSVMYGSKSLSSFIQQEEYSNWCLIIIFPP